MITGLVVVGLEVAGFEAQSCVAVLLLDAGFAFCELLEPVRYFVCEA